MDYTDKISKLLALAEDPAATDGEREAIMDKVAKLTAQFMISDADIQAHREAGTKVENIVRVYLDCGIVTSMRLSFEIASMGASIAEAMNCRGYITRGRGDSVYAKRLILVGYESDVARVTYLWETLQRQISAPMIAALKEENSYRWFTRQDKDNFRNSFIRAFGQRVAYRLSAMRREAVAESATGTDLVLVERLSKVDDWVLGNMKIGKARVRKLDENAMFAGAKAGSRATLGQGDLGADVNAQYLGR